MWVGVSIHIFRARTLRHRVDGEGSPGYTAGNRQTSGLLGWVSIPWCLGVSDRKRGHGAPSGHGAASVVCVSPGTASHQEMGLFGSETREVRFCKQEAEWIPSILTPRLVSGHASFLGPSGPPDRSESGEARSSRGPHKAGVSPLPRMQGERDPRESAPLSPARQPTGSCGIRLAAIGTASYSSSWRVALWTLFALNMSELSPHSTSRNMHMLHAVLESPERELTKDTLGTVTSPARGSFGWIRASLC